MQNETIKRAHDFLTAIQASLAADSVSGTTGPSISPSHLFFMRNGVSIVLDKDDAAAYHSVVETLFASIGKARREYLSRKSVAALVQTAIVAVVPGAQAPGASVASALETLRRGLQAPPASWKIWCSVVDLVPPSQRRQFGRVSLQAATPTSIRAVARLGRQLIGRTTNPPQQKRSLKNRFGPELTEALQGKVIASVTVQAVDQDSAQRLAFQHMRATLDVIGFFGSFLVPSARTPSIDGGAERATTPALMIKHGQFGSWPLAQHKGLLIKLDDLYKAHAARDLRISLVSKLLKKEHLTPSEKRVLTAVRWAGRAAGKARPSEEFLFYLIALETLLLPSEKDSELTYRLKLRAAHLLARKIETRESLFKRIGELYSTRSAIVHTGNQDVSAEDLSSARYFTLTAILVVLRRLGREPDLEAWFVKQALK
jgi:hypothetical protein